MYMLPYLVKHASNEMFASATVKFSPLGSLWSVLSAGPSGVSSLWLQWSQQCGSESWVVKGWWEGHISFYVGKSACAVVAWGKACFPFWVVSVASWVGGRGGTPACSALCMAQCLEQCGRHFALDPVARLQEGREGARWRTPSCVDFWEAMLPSSGFLSIHHECGETWSSPCTPHDHTADWS